jgi:hypothetical protein
MFFAMTPDMIKHLNDLKKKAPNVKAPNVKAPNVKAPNVKAPNVKAPNVKAPMSFEAYYNKRFMEECKYFVENPKFSIKYAMVMSYLQKDIREKALKEYKEKWPYGMSGHYSYISKPLEQSHDNESVISEYDIIDDAQSVQSINSEDLEPEPQSNLRRSKRLLKNSDM